VCLINLGKKEDAVAVLQQCLDADPTMWKAAQALGSVQMQMGEFETGYVYQEG
jgi:Flp pilus assembly protein TadD